jgi:hypothetical protein
MANSIKDLSEHLFGFSVLDGLFVFNTVLSELRSEHNFAVLDNRLEGDTDILPGKDGVIVDKAVLEE